MLSPHWLSKFLSDHCIKKLKQHPVLKSTEIGMAWSGRTQLDPVVADLSTFAALPHLKRIDVSIVSDDMGLAIVSANPRVVPDAVRGPII